MVPNEDVISMVLVDSQTLVEAIESSETQNISHRVDLWL